MKEYLVTASEMKRYDNNTIEIHRLPSLLLMERAALVTAQEIRRVFGEAPKRVLVLAGCGNNGGDGLAVGRLLMLSGYKVRFVLFGEPDRCSEETRRQLEILQSYGASVFGTMAEAEYDMDIVVDALFGVGLSRPVEGDYAEAVEWINQSGAFVCSVDMPSGVCADTGNILGCAVQADLTVTYGFRKLGQLLYPGAGRCGRLVCGQMGIDENSFLGEKPVWYTYRGSPRKLLPPRKPDGNKGTFGKVLVIAGSSQICGAAMLGAKSVLCAGAGMVKVVTAKENRDAVLQYVPEAMLLTYGERDEWQESCRECGERQKACEACDARFWEALQASSSWADCMLIGPGIGLGDMARKLLRFCLEESGLPLVIDADGLNLLVADEALQALAAERQNPDRTIVLTPHLGEFARLMGCETAACKEQFTRYPHVLADRLHCTVVCKDARTLVVQPGVPGGYLNTSGNAGMATAGSGDVLAGMIAGLLAQGMEGFQGAAAGVYLHGLAGDLAARAKSQEAMTATDIIAQLGAAVRSEL